MKKLMRVLLMAGCVAAVSFFAGNAMAQGGPGGGGGGGFGRFQQRMMDDLRTQMDVKDDAEWGAISNAISKVFEVRFAGRGMNRNRGGNNGGDQGGQQQQRRPRFGGVNGPEADALQAALDAKASPDEIKTKLAAVRAANTANHDKLVKAQDDLKQLLTSRQEAVAVLNGLLE
jgi:Spy/CpxP family protein refolding chaperone